MWLNISGRVLLAIFCESYLENAVLFYLSLVAIAWSILFAWLWTWSATMGCLCRHQTIPSYLHHHCGKWYTQSQPSLTDPSKASGACSSRKKGGRKGKVLFLKSERAGLPGSYGQETQVPWTPYFGSHWAPKGKVDPSCPGAQTPLSGSLPSQGICILERCWRFLIKSFPCLFAWVNLVVRRCVNSLALIIYSMYSDVVSWILSTVFSSMKRDDFKFFSFFLSLGIWGYM